MQEMGLGTVGLLEGLLEEVPPRVLEETTVLWESGSLAFSPKSATNRLWDLGPVSSISRPLFSQRPVKCRN